MKNLVTRKNTKQTAVATVPVPVTKKAVAKKAVASLPSVPKTDDVRFDALAAMTRTVKSDLDTYVTATDAKLEALHNMCLTLHAQCEQLERIIVGLQTAKAVDAVPVPVPVPAKKAPAKKAVATNTAVGLPVSYSQLIDAAVDNIIDGINTGRFNTNVIAQCDNDLRVYADTATRKAIKLYRDATKGAGQPVTLATISRDIVVAFERATNTKAETYFA